MTGSNNEVAMEETIKMTAIRVTSQAFLGTAFLLKRGKNTLFLFLTFFP
jgi:hypothetical protein